MKQYTLYLYTKLEDCNNYHNHNECYLHNCPSCELSKYFICDDKGSIIDYSSIELFDLENYHTEVFTIETIDNIPRNGFAEYLKNKDNNYRIIDTKTNKILKYNIPDSELILELIEDFDTKIINDLCNIYNLDEILLTGTIDDLNSIKERIRKLATHRNASVILTICFALVNSIALQSFIENPKFIPLLISGITLICGAKNVSNTQIDNIEITAGKRLILKTKDKRNENS